ncbi:FUSC family protein [Wohlfahrtiimonas larvae]|uniref:FUSC family protein n=1 Tax=Wohlfahrtiimonas larvae TaxID=1157986 RepID=A0ABP9MVV2_9GAMM|nr:FUSC family protein [Wohlfahrtiimonas larvae]
MMAKLQKIFESLARLQYGYAIRVVLGVAIAWFVSFRLQIDKPYWSIMTVMIVTLPTQSELLNKFIARFIGTMVGALMVNIIASIALDDQWLFAIYMAFWLSICAYLATAKGSLSSYGFALCGYTSAILGFTLSIQPSSYMVFQITQARITEILIGLVTAFFVSMLWPSHLDHRQTRLQVRAKRQQIRQMYVNLLTPDYDQRLFIQEYRHTLHDLMSFRSALAMNLFSISEERKDAMGIFQYGQRLIAAMSNVLLIEAMKTELMAIYPAAMTAYLESLRQWLASAQVRSEKILTKPEPPAELLQDIKGRSFIQKLNEKIDYWYSMRLNEDVDEYIPSMRIYYSDYKEAWLNAVRTFFALMLGMFFWMSTGWDMGFVLMVIIGVICTLGATYPMINKLLTISILMSIFIMVPVSYALKFGLLIQATSLLPAMLVVLPFYFIAALIRVSSMLGFLIGYGFLLFSSFLIGFSNPMNYSFALFANSALALVVALCIILLIFSIIRPSSDEQKLHRIKHSVWQHFNALENSQITAKGLKDYEAYLYNAVHKTQMIPDQYGKPELLAFIFLTLVILRAQLRLHEQNIEWRLPEEIRGLINDGEYLQAIDLIHQQKESISDAMIAQSYWEIETAITALNRFLSTGPTTELIC